MEIFERMGWYGFYAVSTLYLTSPVADGGLGLSSKDRGVIQGLSTFFLYFSGAVRNACGSLRLSADVRAVGGSDGSGLSALALAAHVLRIFLVYILVACGHGMFKPVVLSTIEDHDRKDRNARLWHLLHDGQHRRTHRSARRWHRARLELGLRLYASAFWIALMGVLSLVLYREPPHERQKESLSEVLRKMVAVVGNVRFFSLLMGMLLLLVLGNKWWTIGRASAVAVGWLLFHLLWDVGIRLYLSQSRTHDVPWYRQTLRIGEGKYLLFLLLMSGFGLVKISSR